MTQSPFKLPSDSGDITIHPKNLTQNGAAKARDAPQPASEAGFYDKSLMNEALNYSRVAIAAKIKNCIEQKRHQTGAYPPLYDLLIDYPFRGGKMLRPTLCISTARAVGGMGQTALNTAAALELYHNAFLIHDDIEDGSESRRGKDTLHQMIGIPRAINVGDATNVLAVDLLLKNLSVLGASKTLHILHEIEFMAQQSVEGQAMELDWIADNTPYLTDEDYFKMCGKKTCWYTFISPCRIGLIVGHPSHKTEDLSELLENLTRFGMAIGIAFQIQDDLLNLQGEKKLYGKEIGGDIYEGKRTLMLNHVIANSHHSQEIVEILKLPRPEKTQKQVNFILQEMKQYGSIEHGWRVARNKAYQATKIFQSLEFIKAEVSQQSSEQWDCLVHDRRFLKELINYVIYRNI
ncbi:polyprenyl synthetase family protein [Spirulina sp. CS-785/01]|uniref:polyprenyl synthetase family protein n=1 Tax=Spirulina sp. CS-785/01 TaxID=3021716 RepID=UPI002330451A|nr:polyprenyl synthetase family protein [Spirulina sp. CS-785/01]MDB9312200.1 polyprenyl synthetase family protein [Spirulina sp. CS-785/01]